MRSKKELAVVGCADPMDVTNVGVLHDGARTSRSTRKSTLGYLPTLQCRVVRYRRTRSARTRRAKSCQVKECTTKRQRGIGPMRVIQPWHLQYTLCKHPSPGYTECSVCCNSLIFSIDLTCALSISIHHSFSAFPSSPNTAGRVQCPPAGPAIRQHDPGITASHLLQRATRTNTAHVRRTPRAGIVICCR